jgi:hypothetical protein
MVPSSYLIYLRVEFFVSPPAAETCHTITEVTPNIQTTRMKSEEKTNITKSGGLNKCKTQSLRSQNPTATNIGARIV